MSKVELSDNITVTYQDTPDVRKEVFRKVMEYYIKHQVFNGETILQSDTPKIEAPYTLADIADNILKFEVEYEN